jgi:small-conductance mechanosensitive channel
MTSILTTPWFYWSVIISVGLPVTLLVLTELQQALNRRGSFLAQPVGLLRTFIVPLGALLLLLIKTTDISVEATGVRIVSTVFGFIVLVMVLSGVNATVFASAPAGSWRRRMPTIFIDVARFVIIALGLALVLAYVWGANVGGLFTALGVSSIVLGLTLQNSVGQIISGLLLLFEQPFQLGDWVQTTSARGRVVEVNWRATHINTGSGLEIIPNSVLAGQSFVNLSRPAGSHTIVVDAKFAGTDAPDDVCGLLADIASNLPQLHASGRPIATANTSTDYTITIPIRSPADDPQARSMFQRWLWYASRRAGLQLDGIADDFSTPQRRMDALRKIAPILKASGSELEILLPHVSVTRYGSDELMQASGEVPTGMSFILDGRVRMVVDGKDGSVIPVSTLLEGDFIGQTALTREPVIGSAYALGEVTVARIDRGTVEKLVFRKPELLQDLSQAIDERRTHVRELVADSLASGPVSDPVATTEEFGTEARAATS